MKKIILKAKIDQTTRDAFEDKLSDIDMDLTPMYWQHDRIYVPRNYRPNQNYPRLIMRTDLRAIDEEPTYSLILRRHIEDSGVDIVEETPVKDYAATVNIIFQLGFKQISEVSRRRQELKVEEDSIIYFDNIDGRDESYVKIEADLRENESVEKVFSDLEKALTTFSIHDFVNKPYFEL